MKQCPKCNRLVEENALNFCRTDGAALVTGSLAEAATIFLSTEPTFYPAPGLLPDAASSIAVLPFRNLTADPANDYLCVGLAEEIVHALSRIEGLKVAATRSAFSFSGKDVDVRDIGRDLHVEVVLEGSIRLAKNRMRITVQLVSAESGYHVWSQRYDRQLSQTFELKGDIALEIVEALEITLPGPERARVGKRDTENAKAHQLYLQGCFHTGRFTAEGFRTGIEYLNQAIAEDSNYALAYAELARAYHRISHVHLRPAESFMKVKAAAERALELDEDLAEAHSLLAVVAANFYRLPKDAEEGFRHALELAPYNSPIHQRYGSFLMTQGRLAAAVAEFCKAKQLDLLCPILNVLLSATYYFAREPLPALKHAREAILQNESLWFGYWSAALAHEQLGQLIEALGELEEARNHESSPWTTALRARVYAKLGRRDIAEAILDDINRKAGTEWVAPYLVGTVYFALDEVDRGFEWLEKAFDDYDDNLTYLAVDPVMDSLRGDPRFIDLLNRAGLDQTLARTHFVVPVSQGCPSSGRRGTQRLSHA